MKRDNKNKHNHKSITDLLVQFHSLKCICKQHGLDMSVTLLEAVSEDVREYALSRGELSAQELFAIHDTFEASSVSHN